MADSLLPPRWVPEFELRLSGLAASVLTHGASGQSLSPLPFLF